MDSKVTLHVAFTAFAGGDQMDGKQFMKLAKDCKLLDKKLTATDIDLIFPKVKEKGARKITYAQFEAAVKLLADKKGVDKSVVIDKITETGGPHFSGTKADAVKFHDDKSQYTGMYAHHGQHVDKGPSAPDLSKGSAPMEEKKASAPAHPTKTTAVKHAPASSLEQVFSSFAGAGGQMDGKTFAKFAKDCKVLDKKVTTTDVDLTFAKVKAKSERKINFDQFMDALKIFATKKGVDFGDMEVKILAAGGPVFAGTKADKVKFHDDKSLYTGVYAKGGPSTVDAGHGKISDISQLCDRTSADVRGVKK